MQEHVIVHVFVFFLIAVQILHVLSQEQVWLPRKLKIKSRFDFLYLHFLNNQPTKTDKSQEYQELKSKESKNNREEKKGLKNKKQQKKVLNDTAS